MKKILFLLLTLFSFSVFAGEKLNIELTKSEIDCLAKNIYFEGRSEPLEGQIAIGLVTLNRVSKDGYPGTICGVVKQYKQFSWYWDGKPDTPKEKDVYEKIMIVAITMIATYNYTDDITEDATHYHADYVSPYWASSFTKVKKIGKHIFYK